ncbi:hypothetical protein Dsin_022962 [Dipteronia sinensis]|uniref:Uncharacterized protein n=1 Tax=Dipteronia sinensis TaxID=43782 RepID=A0AAE0A3D0_9ROSI|nr:hypothetical protein Dsin_022962 [Dipteronia sinensis]
MAVASLFVEGSGSEKVLRSGLKTVVGNGMRSTFWDLNIKENGQLRNACPRIYALATRKQGVISDFERWRGTQWVWDVSLRRPLFDWENEQWRVFLSCLDCINIRNSIPDILTWLHKPDGKFTPLCCVLYVFELVLPILASRSSVGSAG